MLFPSQPANHAKISFYPSESAWSDIVNHQDACSVYLVVLYGGWNLPFRRYLGLTFGYGESAKTRVPANTLPKRTRSNCHNHLMLWRAKFHHVGMLVGVAGKGVAQLNFFFLLNELVLNFSSRHHVAISKISFFVLSICNIIWWRVDFCRGDKRLIPCSTRMMASCWLLWADFNHSIPSQIMKRSVWKWHLWNHLWNLSFSFLNVKPSFFCMEFDIDKCIFTSTLPW